MKAFLWFMLIIHFVGMFGSLGMLCTKEYPRRVKEKSLGSDVVSAFVSFALVVWLSILLFL